MAKRNPRASKWTSFFYGIGITICSFFILICDFAFAESVYMLIVPFLIPIIFDLGYKKKYRVQYWIGVLIGGIFFWWLVMHSGGP